MRHCTEALDWEGNPTLEEYLGDGVYATYDGYSVSLDLRAQPPTPDCRIALEPAVFAKLLSFQERAVKVYARRAALAKSEQEESDV